ncbi:MAG: TetR/AcrR family transcriptional regulator [Thermoleophilaceae bacterium]
MPPAGPSSAVPAARNPRGHGDRLRKRLLDAAVELVGERGDASRLSVRAVTRRAGVSPTALYLHFDSHEELLQALTERGFSEFREALRGAAGQGSDAAERLFHAGRAYVRFAVEQPALYAVIFGTRRLAPPVAGHPPPPKPPAAYESFDDLVILIEGYLGPSRAEEADSRALARGIWTGLHGYVTLRQARPLVDWEDEEQFVTALGEAWLGPPGD